jgi:hypothetical protein
VASMHSRPPGSVSREGGALHSWYEMQSLVALASQSTSMEHRRFEISGKRPEKGERRFFCDERG